MYAYYVLLVVVNYLPCMSELIIMFAFWFFRRILYVLFMFYKLFGTKNIGFIRRGVPFCPTMIN